MSWYLGAKHPGTTFHSLGLREGFLDLPSSSWGAPPNVKSRLWPESPRLSLAGNAYDMVIVHDLFHVVRCTDWTTLIIEVARVLASGGVLAMSLMDPLPKHSGPALEAWTRKNLEITLAQKFMVPQPSLMVPYWIDEIAQFSEPLVESLELPCYTPSGTGTGRPQSAGPAHKKHRYSTPLAQIQEHSNSRLDDSEVEVDRLIGKHLFHTLYGSCLPTGHSSYASLGMTDNSNVQGWWWDDRVILDECRRFDTAFQMLTFFYRKI
jgi:SAM-dependent methyltransferase